MTKNNEPSMDDIQYHYDKTKKDVDKHGHSIKGVVDGKGHLERPLAYSIGASLTTGYEFVSFFPVKNKGLSIVARVINKIIDLIKCNEFEVDSKIINDKDIYYLSVVMYVLKDFEKKTVELNWARQLERDGFLSEFSTDNHQLVCLIFTDKDGNLPWDSKCGNFWPDICPLPFLASAEYEITGKDNLMRKAENDFGLK